MLSLLAKLKYSWNSNKYRHNGPRLATFLDEGFRAQWWPRQTPPSSYLSLVSFPSPLFTSLPSDSTLQWSLMTTPISLQSETGEVADNEPNNSDLMTTEIPWERLLQCLRIPGAFPKGGLTLSKLHEDRAIVPLANSASERHMGWTPGPTGLLWLNGSLAPSMLYLSIQNPSHFLRLVQPQLLGSYYAKEHKGSESVMMNRLWLRNLTEPSFSLKTPNLLSSATKSRHLLGQYPGRSKIDLIVPSLEEEAMVQFKADTEEDNLVPVVPVVLKKGQGRVGGLAFLGGQGVNFQVLGRGYQEGRDVASALETGVVSLDVEADTALIIEDVTEQYQSLERNVKSQIEAEITRLKQAGRWWNFGFGYHCKQELIEKALNDLSNRDSNTGLLDAVQNSKSPLYQALNYHRLCRYRLGFFTVEKIDKTASLSRVEAVLDLKDFTP